MDNDPITVHHDIDTNRGITPFGHCFAGMHIGKMTPRPVEGEFDAILTVARDAGHVPDLVRHRHIPLTYSTLPVDSFHLAVRWVETQLSQDRKILIRSEGGRERPALVVGAIVIRLGGTYQDALTCARNGDRMALSDFRYKELLQLLAKSVHRAGPWAH